MKETNIRVSLNLSYSSFRVFKIRFACKVGHFSIPTQGFGWRVSEIKAAQQAVPCHGPFLLYLPRAIPLAHGLFQKQQQQQRQQELEQLLSVVRRASFVV